MFLDTAKANSIIEVEDTHHKAVKKIKTTQLLRDIQALHALLAPKGNWCQSSAALDSKGDDIHPLNDHAVQWCLLGGVAKVVGTTDMKSRRNTRLIEALASNIPDSYDDESENAIADFNDNAYTKRPILGLLKRTAREEQQRQKK